MTYPDNPLDAIGADGAFEIGGGDFSFGQDYTEQIIRSLFTMPPVRLDNAINLLREHLLKLPLEALQGFEEMIPDWVEGAFDTVTGAVDAIMDALSEGPLFLKLAEFQVFLQRLLTEPGEVIGEIPQALVNGLTSALETVNNTIQTIVDMLLQALGIDPEGELIDRIFDLSDEIEWLQNTASQVSTGLQQTWNQFWSALTGRNPDKDQTVVEPAEQIGELAGTTQSNSSAIAELQARLDAEDHTGIAGGDDFERVNNTAVGPGWAEFYTGGGYGSGRGYYAIKDGHQAAWTDQGATQNTARFVRTDPADEKTVTDYQKMTLVVGTIPGEATGPFQGGSHIRLWLRVNDNAPSVGITDGVYVEIGGANLAQIGYRRSGSDHLVGSAFSCSWGAGTIFTLVAGTVDGIERVEFYKNGSRLALWSDDGLLSAIGADFRRWGWEGQARNRNLGQGTPSSVTRVTINDNDPSGLGGGGSVNLVTGVVGILQIPNGGTGASSAAEARANLGAEAVIPAGTVAQYWRGDKTWQTLNKVAVGLHLVDNTSDAQKMSAPAVLTNKTISGADNTLTNIPVAALGTGRVSAETSAAGIVVPLSVKLWVGTEAQYQAIATKDSSTLYFRTA
ncbi:minor tail protein [Mycobacterium phage AN3]|nr:minor tail protein [Mycobacterium phage AN3]